MSDKFTDETRMPFGKYQGHLMETVPPEYLLWSYDNGLNHVQLRAYIDDNREGLEQEVLGDL